MTSITSSKCFPEVAAQTCTIVLMNLGRLLFTKQFQLSNVLGISGVNDSLERSYHSISIRLGTLICLGHSISCIFFCISYSDTNLLSCIGLLSCCITNTLLSFSWQTGGQGLFVKCLNIRGNSFFY